jgi:biopolymer transport protein ExbD
MPSLAPLIDVVLILLFFFLLSSSFVVQPGVSVTLYDRVSGSGATANRKVITVTPANDIYYGDRRVTLPELVRELEELSGTSADRTVILKADVLSDLGTVMDVMAALLRQGMDCVLASRSNEGER